MCVSEISRDKEKSVRIALRKSCISSSFCFGPNGRIRPSTRRSVIACDAIKMLQKRWQKQQHSNAKSASGRDPLSARPSDVSSSRLPLLPSRRSSLYSSLNSTYDVIARAMPSRPAPSSILACSGNYVSILPLLLLVLPRIGRKSLSLHQVLHPKDSGQAHHQRGFP